MAKKNPLVNKAAEMFRLGKSMADIGRELNIPAGTVRRWKNTYKWETIQPNGERKKPPKSERSDSVRSSAKDGTKQTMDNSELTDKERLFCVYYSNSYNATMSYKKAYKCSYETAHANAYKTMAKYGIKKEIERLQEIKRQQVLFDEYDLVELQMRIAFADIGDMVTVENNIVRVNSSREMDTQLVREVKNTQMGISIKLEDRQKAINWLTKYFLLHPDDKYKAEFDKKRAEIGNNEAENILENMQSLADILLSPKSNRTLSDFEEKEVSDNE